MPTRRTRPKPVIGWREWVQLPTLCDTPIKAKVDTGARTSALHAFALRVIEVDGVATAAFEVHPTQRSRAGAVHVTWPIEEFRTVRSSDGRDERRPVVVLPARMGTVDFRIEVTLTSRDQMGFRMLLGRAAVRRRFIIDPGRSFVLSDGPKGPTSKGPTS